MHVKHFNLRVANSSGQQPRRRKMAVRAVISFALLFGFVFPVSTAEANVVGSLPAMRADEAVLTYGAGAVCKRKLPDMVTPGDEFAVTVTFAAPADRFHAIGLTDSAPAGWNVSVGVAWTAPQAMVAHTPKSEMAAYIWAGPYAAGAQFTAVYKIKVPIDAKPGSYALSGFLEYYVEPHPAPCYKEAIAGDTQVQVVEMPAGTGVKIVGLTRGVDGAVLPGARVMLCHNGEVIATAMSDRDGHYELQLSGPGDYDVVASKEGFRDEHQFISVTEPTIYNVDFVGDHGLIPEAPSESYVLACAALWRSRESPSQLSTPRLLQLISAWKYPASGV